MQTRVSCQAQLLTFEKWSDIFELGAVTSPTPPKRTRQLVLRAALADARAAPADSRGVEMHGTGTALGDPIEIGAVVAVLVLQHAGGGSSGPPGHTIAAAASTALELAAAKSRFGHSEMAAGALGTARVLARLRTARRVPLLHLRSLNAHVAALLPAGNAGDSAAQKLGSASSAAKKRSATPARQTAPGMMLNAASDDGGVFGISGFAFQGTNAHVVLGAPPPLADGAGAAAALAAHHGSERVPWRHRRIWPLPLPKRLLASVGITAAGTLSGHGGNVLAEFEVALGAPSLAFILDHKACGSERWNAQQ